jgi:vacuolar-type H+-ATPase subunit I/STV1
MKWRLKTANSPYRLDQVEVDMQIRDRTLEILRDRKERKQRKNLVKKMNGEADLCFMNEKFISKLDQEEKLAIKHFAMLKQLDTVQKEKKKLEKLVLTECDKIETRFVKIALLRAQKRSKEHHINSSNNNDTESDSVSSIWGTLRQPKIKPNDAKILKSIDNRVYNAEGYYNASGEFIPAVRDRDKVGLMPATYAQIAVGRISPVLKKRLSKIEKF